MTKVALLPDSSNRWMNPDLKVYKTTIEIDGDAPVAQAGHDRQGGDTGRPSGGRALRPESRRSFPRTTEQVCYVHSGGLERRVVQTGEYNDEYIQILDGLAEGERVSLKEPSGAEREGEDASPASELMAGG